MKQNNICKKGFAIDRVDNYKLVQNSVNGIEAGIKRFLF